VCCDEGVWYCVLVDVGVGEDDVIVVWCGVVGVGEGALFVWAGGRVATEFSAVEVVAVVVGVYVVL